MESARGIDAGAVEQVDQQADAPLDDENAEEDGAVVRRERPAGQCGAAPSRRRSIQGRPSAP